MCMAELQTTRAASLRRNFTFGLLLHGNANTVVRLYARLVDIRDRVIFFCKYK